MRESPPDIDAATRLLTGRETADRLAMSERSLYALTEPRGPLRCVRLPGRVMYRLSDIAAWLDAMQADPRPAKQRLQPIVRRPKRGGHRRSQKAGS
jgi:hypothetical protein